MQPMRFAGVAAARTNAWGLAMPRLSTVAQRRWTSSTPSTEDRAAAVESAPKEGEGEEKMTPNAYKQEAAFRKDPIQPYIDGRTRDPLYNPVVDDWVDYNNPRWKALKHTFNRPGPFFIGKCVSTKTAKTSMIEVPYWVRSMKYGKHMAVRRTTRFMAHDEDQICEPGDVVEIRQSKKWSKRKNTVVTRILKKDPGNAFIAEHPEFAIVRSRADLRKRIEQMREDELASAGLDVGQGKRKTDSSEGSESGQQQQQQQ